MCQLIVFWHTCSHFILSYMKCPFDGATTHEEETTTTALVDYECWLCKQGPEHKHWERIERVKTTILTVEHLETILDVSSYDADFLPRVAGFYARGDHKRWGQPGEGKAKNVKQDPYIKTLDLEIALEACGEKKFPMNPGLMFDLEFSRAKRSDINNFESLFWPLKGWQPPSRFFYSSSTMLNLLPSTNQARCDGKMNQSSPLAPHSDSRQVFSSKPSDHCGSPSSAASLSLYQNTWNSPAIQNFLPVFCDNVSDWMQLQNIDASVSETQGSLVSENLFGFDPCSLDDTVMPDLYPQMIENPLHSGLAIQPPIGPYQIPANGFNPLYAAGSPMQTSDTSTFPEMLSFGYSTPNLAPRPTSSSASMSPMSSCYHAGFQPQPQQPMNQTPNLFEYGTSNQFLSASIPAAQINSCQMPQAPEMSIRRSPAKKQLSSGLFRSHGRPDERYLTPLPSGTSAQMYETPDEASEKTYSTAMDTDSSSPSPSVRLSKGKAAMRQIGPCTLDAAGAQLSQFPLVRTPVQAKRTLAIQSTSGKNTSSGSRKRRRDNRMENT